MPRQRTFQQNLGGALIEVELVAEARLVEGLKRPDLMGRTHQELRDPPVTDAAESTDDVLELVHPPEASPAQTTAHGIHQWLYRANILQLRQCCGCRRNRNVGKPVKLIAQRVEGFAIAQFSQRADDFRFGGVRLTTVKETVRVESGSQDGNTARIADQAKGRDNLPVQFGDRIVSGQPNQSLCRTAVAELAQCLHGREPGLVVRLGQQSDQRHDGPRVSSPFIGELGGHLGGLGADQSIRIAEGRRKNLPGNAWPDLPHRVLQTRHSPAPNLGIVVLCPEQQRQRLTIRAGPMLLTQCLSHAAPNAHARMVAEFHQLMLRFGVDVFEILHQQRTHDRIVRVQSPDHRSDQSRIKQVGNRLGRRPPNLDGGIVERREQDAVAARCAVNSQGVHGPAPQTNRARFHQFDQPIDRRRADETQGQRHLASHLFVGVTQSRDQRLDDGGVVPVLISQQFCRRFADNGERMLQALDQRGGCTGTDPGKRGLRKPGDR